MTRLACFLMVCLSLLAACGENGAQSSRVDEPAPLDPTMLGQDQPALRETGFEQISKLETADALALILSKLHHEPDDALIRRVRSWLLGLPAQRLKSVIPYVRKTTHAQVRVMLAVAMAGHPSLRGELLRMCQDPDMQVRRQAALALGQQAPVALLEDKAPEVRILVAELLGRTADGESDWRVQLAVDRKNSRIGAEALPPMLRKRAGGVSDMVRAGVLWLLRHQEADGGWSGWSHNRRGKGGLPGLSYELAYADPSLTGLAVLALLHSGAQLEVGREGRALARGIAFLRRLQKSGGMVGYSSRQETLIRQELGDQTPRPKSLVVMFNHAIAAWALVEAAATTRDTDLEIAASRALLTFYRERHGKYPWSRWLDPDDDVAYAAYTVCALAVARGATELPVEPEMIEGVEQYIKKVTHASGRLYHGGRRAFCFGGYDSTASGLFMRQAIPVTMPAADRKAAALILSRLPHWNGRFPEPPTLEAMANDPGPIVNYHYWHFGAMAVSRLADQPTAQVWRERLVRVLTTHQRRGPWLAAGSWDPCGPWSRVGGRIYSTASALMALLAPRAYDWKAVNKG